MARYRIRPIEQRALTPAQIWGADLQAWPGTTLAGVHVGPETALNAPAVWACVRLISNDIAGLPLNAFRKQDDYRTEIRLPEWVDRPLPDPNVTRGVFIQQLVTSLLLDGNVFLRFYPSIRNPTAVQVLDPATVGIQTDARGIEVVYLSSDGRLSPEELIHIPLIVLPGKRRGVNPVEAASETIGLSIAADQYGAAFFGNGTTMSGFISFPEGEKPTPETVEEIKAAFRKKHVGVRNSHAFGILSDGAKWNQLSSNNRDSQFLELRQYQVEDVARLYGVPPHLVGSQQPGAVSYSSVEQRSIDYVSKAIQPIVEKIEDAFGRTLRGPNTYFKFELDGLLRADIKTRYETYAIGLTNKFLTGDEVRAWEDLEPKGLGFLETPNNNAGGAPPPEGGEPVEPPKAVDGQPLPPDDGVITRHRPGGKDHDQTEHGKWAEGVEPMEAGGKLPKGGQEEVLTLDPTRTENLPESYREKLWSVIRDDYTQKDGTVITMFGDIDDATLDANLDAIIQRGLADADSRKGLEWYEEARVTARDIAAETGVSEAQAAAAIAGLSPQHVWGSNVEAARWVGKMVRENPVVQLEPEWTALVRTEMAKRGIDTIIDGTRTLDSYSIMEQASIIKAMGRREGLTYIHDENGKRRAVSWSCGLNGIADGVAAFRGENPDVFLAGHKVRSFFNNIYFGHSSNGAVTIDTHAYSAALNQAVSSSDPRMKRLTGGCSSVNYSTKGTYAVFADAYRRVAGKYHLSPEQAQAVIWLQWRKETLGGKDDSDG